MVLLSMLIGAFAYAIAPTNQNEFDTVAECLRTAALAWLAMIGGWVVANALFGKPSQSGLRKRCVDFWIPFVTGCFCADLHVQMVTGRSAIFYLAILIELDAQRWMGSGGAAPQWTMFVPFVITIAVSCILARFVVAFGRTFPVPKRVTLTLTVGAVIGLAVTSSGLRSSVMPLADASVPDGWQRKLDVESQYLVANTRPEDIVLFVLESLRPDAVADQAMPFVNNLAHRGFQLPNHYSGANSSLPGLYSLLNGSPAVNVKANLESGDSLDLLTLVETAGYQTLFVCGGDPGGYESMDRLLSTDHFDRCFTRVHQDWVEGDRWSLGQLERQLQRRAKDVNADPIFAVVFLTSTHFAYQTSYLSKDDLMPIASDASLMVPTSPGSPGQLAIKNRYWNCARQLDSMMSQAMASFAESGGVIAVTGDHGQSLYDDGTIAHWSRLSDAQTRVPFVVSVPQDGSVPVHSLTTHADAAAILAGIATDRAWKVTDDPILLVQVNPDQSYEDWVIIDRGVRGAWRHYNDRDVFMGPIDVNGVLLGFTNHR